MFLDDRGRCDEAGNRRMSDCVKQKERGRMKEGDGGEVGDREQGKSKARYSTENNIRADDDDRI